ncbi:MAG: hypothetical protein IJS44_06525 [Clostridia bacterium]|nr:hypothetical protein [Clostridia bacterium]
MMKHMTLHPKASRLLRACLFFISLYLGLAVVYAHGASLSAAAVLELLHSGALSVVIAVGGALILDLEFRHRQK